MVCVSPGRVAFAMRRTGVEVLYIERPLFSKGGVVVYA
jgi:hypothetical protein